MNWGIYFVEGMELLFLGIAAYYDLKTKEIPTEVFGLFGLLAVGCNVFWAYQSMESVISGCMMGMFFVVVGWVTKEAIGYGDGIGLVVLGIFSGGKRLLGIVFIACLLGAIYGIWSLIGLKQSKEDTMPFFPFLFLSAMGEILL